MPPIEEMTPQEIAEWMKKLEQELLRRQNIQLFEDKLTELHAQFRAQGLLPTHEEGAEYVMPGESRNAYGPGDVVTFNGVRRRAKAGVVVCTPDCPDHWIDA